MSVAVQWARHCFIVILHQVSTDGQKCKIDTENPYYPYGKRTLKSSSHLPYFAIPSKDAQLEAFYLDIGEDMSPGSSHSKLTRGFLEF
jgi:hypothetical protein